MPKKIKIVSIVGARPNFMKIAPLIEEYKKHGNIKAILVHTGQHYSNELNKVFFKEFCIPKPNFNLGIGSGSHGRQTGEGLIKFEKILIKEKPDLVVVVGDANSALIGALTAAKLKIKVAHIEAGLRSFNRAMPEEINRVVADHLSDLLFVSELSGVKNLIKEGIDRRKIFFVGNVMIDTLLKNRKIAIKKSHILDKLGVKPGKYALITMHRPENVDKKEGLLKILELLKNISRILTVVWPIHPRSEANLKSLKLYRKIIALPNLKIIKPLGYSDFLKLMSNSSIVLTDSGGVQEETTALGIACLTLRKETERPITVKEGTNKVVGLIKNKVLRALKNRAHVEGRIPKFWDGKTSKRIVKIILKELNK